MPKAYSYIRFSSAGQAEGDSHRRQLEAVQDYCQQHGLDLATDEEYTFFDRGRSAYKGKHITDDGELARFLQLVEEGAIAPGSYLIAESFDRLSRERLQIALSRFLGLLNQGIQIVTLTDGRRYDSSSDVTDILVSIIYMSRAHEESATKAVRVSAAWQNKHAESRKARTPFGKNSPYWLELVDGQYAVIDDRAAIVREVFKLAKEGRGKIAIATVLNERGVPVFNDRRKDAPSQWSGAIISKLLGNERVRGLFQPGQIVQGKRVPVGEPIPDYYPRVISEEEWWSAQAAISLRRTTRATKNTHNFNVWQGIAFCGRCGAAMHIINKGQGRSTGYLRCYDRVSRGCTNHTVRVDRSEDVFKEVLAKVNSLALVKDNSRKIAQQIEVVEGKLSSVQDRLKDSSALLDEVPSKALALAVQKLENEVEELKQERASLHEQSSQNSITSKEDFFSKLDLVSYEGRNAANTLIKRLGLKVYMTSSGNDWVGYDVSKEKPNPLKGKWAMFRFQQVKAKADRKNVFTIHFDSYEEKSYKAGIAQGDVVEGE